ncbi:hypothetical protein ACLOJK_029821 [Asimina triloba]
MGDSGETTLRWGVLMEWRERLSKVLEVPSSQVGLEVTLKGVWPIFGVWVSQSRVNSLGVVRVGLSEEAREGDKSCVLVEILSKVPGGEESPPSMK